jgi:hypothetical protein
MLADREDLIAAGMDDYVSIDPLLQDPLDLVGAKAKKRHVAEALARELDLWSELDMSTGSTLCVWLWQLRDGVLDALHAKRVACEERAHQIARDATPEDAGNALSVLMAIGPGQTALAGGSPGEVCGQIKRALQHRAAPLILRMFRQWTKRGFLHEIGGGA